MVSPEVKGKHLKMGKMEDSKFNGKILLRKV
jgi:hypothetical protein